jgi:DNA-binding FadR family transcriptional regulator
VPAAGAAERDEQRLLVPILRPIRGGNAFEETVERLLQTIKLGVVGPGASLPAERELAVRLRVSRETVRDAIASLREAGYLESRRGRYGGTFVVERTAGRSLRAVDRARLRRLEHACCAAPLATYRPADSRLHLALAEMSGSPSLAAAVADARVRINDLLDGIPLLPRNIEHSNAQHGIVVHAVLDGDPVAAQTAMAEHLEGTAALLRAFLA